MVDLASDSITNLPSRKWLSVPKLLAVVETMSECGASKNKSGDFELSAAVDVS